MKKQIYIISVMLAIVTSITTQQKEFPILTGPYLGQQPPGMTPEIFAPGVVRAEHRVYANVTFSPDLKEVCWTPNSEDGSYWHGGILFSERTDGVWSEPREIRFLGEGYAHRSPTMV